MGRLSQQRQNPARRIAVALAALVAACALALPGGATAGKSKLHYYHGTLSNGQYLNLTVSSHSALVSFTRLWEKCHPGGIHLLVNPAVLLNFASLNKHGSFSRTMKLGKLTTTYKGVVKRNRARVTVDDENGQNGLCEGSKVTFHLKKIR